MAGPAVGVPAPRTISRAGVVCEKERQAHAGRTHQPPVLVEETARAVADVRTAGSASVIRQEMAVAAAVAGEISSIIDRAVVAVGDAAGDALHLRTEKNEAHNAGSALQVIVSNLAARTSAYRCAVLAGAVEQAKRRLADVAHGLTCQIETASRASVDH